MQCDNNPASLGITKRDFVNISSHKTTRSSEDVTAMNSVTNVEAIDALGKNDNVTQNNKQIKKSAMHFRNENSDKRGRVENRIPKVSSAGTTQARKTPAMKADDDSMNRKRISIENFDTLKEEISHLGDSNTFHAWETAKPAHDDVIDTVALVFQDYEAACDKSNRPHYEGCRVLYEKTGPDTLSNILENVLSIPANRSLPDCIRGLPVPGSDIQANLIEVNLLKFYQARKKKKKQRKRNRKRA